MLSTSYLHLKIEREKFSLPRRKPKIGGGAFKPPERNIPEHKDKLSSEFNAYQRDYPQDPDSSLNLIKIEYEGFPDLALLKKNGIECIEQTDNHVVLSFQNEESLTTFSSYLDNLGTDKINKSLTNLLQMFAKITGWTADDRKSWAINHIGFPSSEIYSLDIELWPIYTRNHPERDKLITVFEKFLQTHNIKKLDKLNKESLILYRIEINHSQKELLLNHPDIRMVDLPPKSGITFQTLNKDINSLPNNIPQPAMHAPRICILDSGIATNHPLIAPAVADSVNFTNRDNPFDECGHGTAVAGIALYGDLELRNQHDYWVPEFWILNGKILDHNNEFIEETIESTLDKAIRHFKHEYNCRIFNLSIGNLNAPYDNLHIKGIAYTLDQLSRELDVLIIVSTGNFTGTDTLPKKSWRDEYPDYLMENVSRIIDPAPALNTLTIGSLAKHNQTYEASRYPHEVNQLSPANKNQPSPFTRRGPSIKGALKPDLVAHGGNYAVNVRHDHEYKPISQRLGVLSLRHDFVGNSLLTESSGTSFSAPYITHLVARIIKEYPNYSNNLVRALLANHARIPNEITSTFPQEMLTSYEQSCKDKGLGANRKITEDIAGYGLVNENNLFRSTEDVVVLLQDDLIKNDTNNFYELPIPIEFLRKQRATREIHVSLAYTPPVRTTRADYRATKITFTLIRDDRPLDQIKNHFDQNLKDDKDTIGEYSGNRSISKTIRDKGTLQSSSWKIRQGNPEHKFYLVVTRQDTDWGNNLCDEEESYAIAVTITDRENEEAQLYTQIEQKLRIKQQNRIRL